MPEQLSTHSFPTLRLTPRNSPPYSTQLSALLHATLRLTCSKVRRRVSSSTAESHIKQGGESYRSKRRVLPPVRNGTIDMHPGHISQQFSVPEKKVSFLSEVAKLQKTRQIHPKRNQTKKRFSGFDTPSKCVSPNVFRGFVKSTAQKTGEVQNRNSPAPTRATATSSAFDIKILPHRRRQKQG